MAIASDLDIILGVILFISVSKNNTSNIDDINKCRGNSFFTVFCFTVKFLIIAAAPSINRPLVILLPITLPNTMSVLPEAIALKDIANSGAPVPNATIVRPISIFDTLKFWAVDDAPSIKISAPLIRRIKPIISNIN